MSYSVTSWFMEQALQAVPPVKRVFTIGGSDYSRYVQRWPSVSVGWNDIRTISATISLANDEQTFNFFRTDKVNMRKAIAVKIGFTHPTSGDELINIHLGTVDKVSYANGDCTLTVSDKFKKFSERVVGSSNSVAVFSSSTMLPSDVAWTLCTCYGGLDTTQSSANTDIDWSSFQAWALVFSTDAVYVRARFEGNQVTEALRKIGRYTRSAIYQQNDKLTFHRFTLANTAVTSLTNNEILRLTDSVDDADMTNRQWVYGDYKPESSYWGLNVAAQNSASVNSYQVRENVEKDESIWYVSSANCLNMAERVMFTAGLPYDRVEVETPLTPLPRSIGETLVIIEPQTEIAQAMRIMNQTIDVGTGRMKFTVDASQLVAGFTLDVSSLDGTDVLT